MINGHYPNNTLQIFRLRKVLDGLLKLNKTNDKFQYNGIVKIVVDTASWRLVQA